MLPFFNPFLLTTSVRENQTKNSAKPLTASAWRKHTLNPASQPQLSKRSKQSTEDQENNCFILPNVVSPVIVKRQSDKIVDEIADGKLKSKNSVSLTRKLSVTNLTSWMGTRSSLIALKRSHPY